MSKPHPRTLLEALQESSPDQVPGGGIENDALNPDVLKDQLDGLLQIIDGGLSALAPSVCTAREFSHQQRELCKLGLEVAHLVVRRLKLL